MNTTCIECNAEYPPDAHGIIDLPGIAFGLCPPCRRLIEVGRAVEAMKPGEELHRYAANDDGENWRFYPIETGMSLQFKSPIEALRGKEGK